MIPMTKRTKTLKKAAAKTVAPSPTQSAAPTPLSPAITKPAPVTPAIAKPALVSPALAKPAPVTSAVAKSVPVIPPAAKPIPAIAPEVKTAAPAPPPPKTNRISLELVKPGAKAVYVAGSFNEWKPERTPLAPAGNGVWTGNLNIKPGRHEYLFVVDGQWLPDPNAKESVCNPFGGLNSVLVVSE